MQKLRAISFIAVVLIVLSPLGAAQTGDLYRVSASDMTPRERVISFVKNNDFLDTPERPQTVKLPETETISEPDITAEAAVSNETPLAPEPLMIQLPVKKVADTALVPLANPTPLPAPPSHKRVKEDFSFYVSLSDYISQRKTPEHKQLKLKCRIEKTYVKSGILADPVDLTMTLGSDYVFVERDGASKLFDFKTNRIVTLISDKDRSRYTNRSLYADVFRRVLSVNKQTQKGKRSTLKINGESSLDAFWLEADLGWTARSISDQIKATATETGFVSEFEGKQVLSLNLEGPKFLNAGMRRSLLAYWHLDLSIHPDILSGLTQLPALPDRITTLSKSPKLPEGTQTVWTLISHDKVTSDFPVLSEPEDVSTETQDWPIGFVLKEAAQERALGGVSSNDVLRERIFDLTSSENWEDAWITAQYLAERLDGCENDLALLCEDINQLEANAVNNSEFKALLDARAARGTDARLTALKNLSPYLEASKNAYALRLAGKLRSRLKPKDASGQGFQPASTYLESAVILNPYDPYAWRLLAQVYAAQGRLDESWHIQDGLRRLSHTPEKLTEPITRAESTLTKQASGFFHAEH